MADSRTEPCDNTLSQFTSSCVHLKCSSAVSAPLVLRAVQIQDVSGCFRVFQGVSGCFRYMWLLLYTYINLDHVGQMPKKCRKSEASPPAACPLSDLGIKVSCLQHDNPDSCKSPKSLIILKQISLFSFFHSIVSGFWAFCFEGLCFCFSCLKSTYSLFFPKAI